MTLENGHSQLPNANLDALASFTTRPLPENEAKLREARKMPPHPMQGCDFDSDLPRTATATYAQKPVSSTAPRKDTGTELWPAPMQAAAFHGLAGDFVRLVLPETEADPAALLLTFLVGIGTMIGRKPYYQVEATRHHVNLFTVIVGETSRARKGTATDRAVNVLARADSDFFRQRMRSGLSSGEGLIQAVRDAREEDVATKVKISAPLVLERQVVDNGEPDKRLLVVETEFGSVLQQSGREGNILSTILRDCWDSRPLRVLARSNKDSCEAPHISLIGNVTAQELSRLLTTTDRANGFGNRILWCCARRSKLLPFGGKQIDEQMDAMAARVRDTVAAAGEMGRVRFDEQAGPYWQAIYGILANAPPGMAGALTARAEAQTLRLCLLYALLDRSQYIRVEHVKAAQEVWGYCEESVTLIFGDAQGDDTADTILKLLREAEGGMTKTELNRAFGGHKSTAELTRALTFLEEKGRIRSEREATSGNMVTRWRLCA